MFFTNTSLFGDYMCWAMSPSIISALYGLFVTDKWWIVIQLDGGFGVSFYTKSPALDWK